MQDQAQDRRRPVRGGVEIGRLAGGSTVLLAAAISEVGQLTSIDIGPRADKELGKVLDRLGIRDRVSLCVGDANVVNVEGLLDFVFIDGDHSYHGAKMDHLRWAKRLKCGGFLFHHDMGESRKYSTAWSTLKSLKEEVDRYQEEQLEWVATAGSLVVYRRTQAEWKDF